MTKFTSSQERKKCSVKNFLHKPKQWLNKENSTMPKENIIAYEKSDNYFFIKKPKVLLVEDTAIIQKINMNYLNSLGCDPSLAEDGFEAIAMFKANNYDLIFLDIGLPSKNGIHKSGFDVVQEIRCIEKETGAERTSVIALTAFGDSILEDCIKAGCDDFHTKPLAIDSFSIILQHWLPQHVNYSKTADLASTTD